MAAVKNISARSELAIIDRVFRSRKPMTATLARHLLGLGFDKNDQRRMNLLANKNQLGQLTARQHEELMHYVKAGHVLALLQSKARQV